MSEPEESDYSFDHVANRDQMQENVFEVGEITASYFRHLVELGFSRKEAFNLTRDWHGSFWSSAHEAPISFDLLDDFDEEH